MRLTCTGTLLCTPSPVLLECSDCGWLGLTPDDRHVDCMTVPTDEQPVSA